MKTGIAVIGLGIMGGAICANLAKAGYAVAGYDPLAKRRAELKRAGGRPARDTAEAVRGAAFALTSLPSSEALLEAAAAIAAAGKPGLVVIETSTLPIDAKESARDILAARRIVLLDCPLSGTGAQARVRDLSVYASGPRAAVKRCAPVFEAFAREHFHLGAFGTGSKMKFVANLLVAIHNVSTAEAFALGMKAGLDPKTIYEVMANSAGASRMFQVRGPQMVEGKYDDATISVGLFQKDMKIIGEFAAEHGVATPLFNASAVIYNAAIAQGFAKQDTAAVCAVLESMAGIKR